MTQQEKNEKILEFVKYAIENDDERVLSKLRLLIERELYRARILNELLTKEE